VIVVDNGSRDGSVKMVRSEFPDASVLDLGENVGFARANNAAFKVARGEFFLLLNSDAFVEPGAIKALVECLRSHDRAAVAGPRLHNRDGTLQHSCYRFPTPPRAWAENLWISSALPAGSALGDFRRWGHDAERDVDWVSGACFLVRRSAYEQTGGFDESYFMYQEETDWQRRLRDCGWAIVFTPEARVTHLGGGSGGNEPARINSHFFDSLDRYVFKHHGLAGLVSVRCAMIVGCSLRTALWLLVMVFIPRRRRLAASKAGLSSSLVVRQAIHWRTGFRTEAIR
jgi:GT2 family glycosyltransferase